MVAKPLYPLYKNIIKPLDRVRYPELRYFMDLYEQYLSLREKFNGIYGTPTEILDESFEETLEFGQLPMCATYYKSSKGLISLEISEDKHCVEISFQDKHNAEIMRKEKTQK